LPQSLGNSDLVLPPGVVCDTCNSGTLSLLDQGLCDFGPLKLRRTMLGVPSKAGKVPTFRYAEGTIEYQAPINGGEPTLILRNPSPKFGLREVERFTDGRVMFEWNGSGGGRRLTPRYASDLSRALLKAALECAWIDHGEMALESRFDHVRAAVLGEARDGCLVLGNKCNPDRSDGALTYQPIHEDDVWRMMVWVQLHGVYIGTDSRLASPRGAVPEDLVTLVRFTTADC
jgi:hypothetical protein